MGTLRLRDEFSEILHDEILRDVCGRELDALDVLLEDVGKDKPELKPKLRAIEGAAGTYAALLAEAAFVAGLEYGRDLSRLLCQQPARSGDGQWVPFPFALARIPEENA